MRWERVNARPDTSIDVLPKWKVEQDNKIKDGMIKRARFNGDLRIGGNRADKLIRKFSWEEDQ